MTIQMCTAHYDFAFISAAMCRRAQDGSSDSSRLLSALPCFAHATRAVHRNAGMWFGKRQLGAAGSVLVCGGPTNEPDFKFDRTSVSCDSVITDTV